MHVTVCICTRDRGLSVRHTMRSIADLSYDDLDVVIVDQSAADVTERAVRSAGGFRHEVTYVRSRLEGTSVARNVAIAHARGPIVAFTDDDCEVSADWLTEMVRYFHDFPTVGQVFGEVRAGAYDSGAGFIPTYRVERCRLIASPWLKWREGGIGANMAFRREALAAVGPFDELLGPGAAFPSCEEGDMTYRMLRSGYSVLNVPGVYVVHNGFRSWQQGQALMKRTAVGIAAAYMKHLRLGDVAVLPTLFIEWLRSVAWLRLLLLQKHTGLARFVWYARGMRSSYRFGVDRRRRLYRRRSVR